MIFEKEGHYSAFIYDETLSVQLERSTSIPCSVVVRIRDGIDLVFINVSLPSTASSQTETSTFLSKIINTNATDRSTITCDLSCFHFFFLL